MSTAGPPPLPRHLEEIGYRCTILHGGKTQDQREAGIKGFRWAGQSMMCRDMQAARSSARGGRSGFSVV